MRSVFALAALSSLVVVAHRPASTTRVMVHCPAGDTAGFVTPAQVQIALGDSIEWRMTGRVQSDSVIIALKNNQAWPFNGAEPRGAASARTGAASARGTYSYSVTLDCRMPGGVQRVVIDPDIIIE